jgi:hypothetical protein
MLIPSVISPHITSVKASEIGEVEAKNQVENRKQFGLASNQLCYYKLKIKTLQERYVFTEFFIKSQ